MNKGLIGFVGFVLGLGAGAATTYVVMNKKHNEEIVDIKKNEREKYKQLLEKLEKPELPDTEAVKEEPVTTEVTTSKEPETSSADDSEDD